MKIASKQILSRREAPKTPAPKHKGLSKSVSKPLKIGDMGFESPKKKTKKLEIIKEAVKKKKEDKKEERKEEKREERKEEKREDKKTADKDKEKKKKVNYCLNLKELKPVNLEREKQLFFQNDCQYNPFFIYPNISDLNDEAYKDVKRFDTADNAYLEIALAILEKSLHINMPERLKQARILTEEEVSAKFTSYINALEFGSLITFQFAENTIAPTSVIHNNQDSMSKVVIGLPIKYRENTIEGVMNHEIGTHFIRKFNDKNQKWYKDRKKYGLTAPYLQTEEGLASLNQLVSYAMQEQEPRIPPLLYRAALLYYCCFLASRCSFSQVFTAIAKYQPDPQARWKECVRAKRGIADTSKSFGMYKDQIYLMGAVEILKNRRRLNLVHLHSGKITVEDCLRLSEKHLISEEKVKVPYFLNNQRGYLKCLDAIAQFNMIKE